MALTSTRARRVPPFHPRAAILELKPDSSIAEIASFLENALRSIRYGAVEITIHDGRVVQIERKEKLRFEPPLRADQRK